MVRAMIAASTARISHAVSVLSPDINGVTPLRPAWTRALTRTLPPVPMNTHVRTIE